MRTVVPSALRVQGPQPTRSRRTCSECGWGHLDHSGIVCAICRRPIEHHTDPGDMRLEVEGHARMARARVAAGAPVRDSERWALRYVETQAA